MKITREWAMPNKRTFQIKPIADLLSRYGVGAGWVDPFCGESKLAQYRNDLNPSSPGANSYLPALDFLHSFKAIENVVFDPPYTLRQAKESYESVGLPFLWPESHNAGRWTAERRAIAYRIQDGGLVISFGYSTTCMGKQCGFEIIEIMLVSHGGAHYDTLVTVERKP